MCASDRLLVHDIPQRRLGGAFLSWDLERGDRHPVDIFADFAPPVLGGMKTEIVSARPEELRFCGRPRHRVSRHHSECGGTEKETEKLSVAAQSVAAAQRHGERGGIVDSTLKQLNLVA